MLVWIVVTSVALAGGAGDPLEYADGSTAVVTQHGHQVFAKGDLEKREFFKATCR